MSGTQIFNVQSDYVFATLAAMQAIPAGSVPAGTLCIALDTVGGVYMYDSTSPSTLNTGDVYPTTAPGVFFISDIPVAYLNDNNQFTLFNTSAETLSLAQHFTFIGNASNVAAPVKIASYVVYSGTQTNGGGSATIAITVTGLLSTDIVFAQVQASTNACSVLKSVPTANTLTVTLSADPGASTIIQYMALRAA